MALTRITPLLRPLSGLTSTLSLVVCLLAGAPVQAFDVDTSAAPSSHHAIIPEDGERVSLNPPSMVWREDKTAASYIVELSADGNFAQGHELIRVEGVGFPFYNHDKPLTAGKWFWRYFVVREGGEVSRPGPVRSFVINEWAEAFPIPSMDAVFAIMPEHPRIFVTPESLDAFQAKREGAGKEAWQSLEVNAQRALNGAFEIAGRRIPIAEAKIEHSVHSRSHQWKEGEPIRRQVFFVDDDGQLFWLPDNGLNLLNAAAQRLNTLSLAWQISADEKYLDGARALLALVSSMRVDAHLSQQQRAEHDTVVYAYENGLKAMAVAYDRMYHELEPSERSAVLRHVEYHAENAGQWLKSVEIHTSYQISHPQQCMHALLVTVLATAKDSPQIDKWVRYLVPQYMNRTAWTSEDGGYFEGQTYGHKFAWILEGLAAIRSATGVDLFKKPEIRNSGEFWLYAMNLNYWFQHWGDNYSLIWPYANPSDAYITAFLAAMNDDPYVKWYSETILTNPEVSPFDYISAGSLKSRPPVDTAQARLFGLTGSVAAYNGLYDHSSERIFFRSSRWGSHSHSHADQNGFVIHSGGEILAPDTGYYTYYGDTYDAKWSKSTFAHNSMLVNGQPQPRGIRAKGDVTNFFHGGRLTYFVGDASKAYTPSLQAFRRAVLYVRPATYVIYDELASTAPATYSWLLNVFDEPQIDTAERRMTISQQQMRMQVDTVLPEQIVYTASNKRPYPIKEPKMAWSRFTEAFPQPWHIRVENAKPAKDETFLTLLQTWNAADAVREQVKEAIQTATTVGMRYASAEETATVLFRRKLNGTGEIAGGGVRANAQSVSVFRSADEALRGWSVASGNRLETATDAGELKVFGSEFDVSASADYQLQSCAAQLAVSGKAGTVTLLLSQKPAELFVAPALKPQLARTLDFIWDDETSSASFTLADDAEVVVWVDPVAKLNAPLAKGELVVTDSSGEYRITLEPAWTEQGDVMYFAEVMPREAGDYIIRQSGAETKAQAQLLIQDRWDPYSLSSRGQRTVSGLMREGSWLYFRTQPGAAGSFTATLEAAPRAGEIDNILFNGDFEYGTSLYPPRGWTMDFSRDESLAWFHWTQEDAKSGKSAVKYTRDKGRYQLTARPMRLLTPGTYHLRFYARGDIDDASIIVRGREYRNLAVAIKKSDNWIEYHAQIDLPSGYTTVSIQIPEGKEGEVLWVDQMEFGLMQRE